MYVHQFPDSGSKCCKTRQTELTYNVKCILYGQLSEINECQTKKKEPLGRAAYFLTLKLTYEKKPMQ